MSYRLLDPRAFDDRQLCELHRRSFGPQWDLRRWQWRFRDGPGRPAIQAARSEGGRFVAQLAGVGLDFVGPDGEAFSAINIGDVAVDPDWRRGLGGSRLLKELAQRYFRRCGEEFGLCWGFPVPPLRRVLNRYCRVDVLRDVVLLGLETRAPVAGTEESITVAAVYGAPAAVDALEERVLGSLARIRRSASYLDWRYVAHPDVGYRLYQAVDRFGTLRGVMVQRPGGWHEETATLSEFLVEREDESAQRALLQHAQAEALDWGRSHLVAWMPEGGWFRHLQERFGFRALVTPHQECFRSWTGGIDREWLYRHWYQTMGDMDFY